jgi:hypothetical protein
VAREVRVSPARVPIISAPPAFTVTPRVFAALLEQLTARVPPHCRETLTFRPA